jgi:hypothetical protein
MRFQIYIIPALILLFLVGCAGFQSEHPELEAGMKLTDAYRTVHYQYQEVYSHVSPSTQSFMKSEIAPKMDQLKDNIILYNEAVLAGTAQPSERRVIFSQLRDLAQKLNKLEKEADDES